ncbi:MAG: hypothetical protein SCARUB_04121 [Candidatus Scalindua rubra]|uniref:Transporter n=1 Tax=Candidatus Scalindua rubra TaxID=1872076 RepID=A0A1E3X5D4_9BACT|nr:MAG: hypothetical protein SCARUB_04121 [Candidatus Scalindua rubra]
MLSKYTKWLLVFLFFNGIIFFNQAPIMGHHQGGVGGIGGIPRGQSAFSPETLGRDKLSLSFLFDYQDWKHFDPFKAHELEEGGRDAHSRRKDTVYNAVISYGVTDNLSLTFQFPFVERRTRQIETEELIGQREKSTGIGDVTTFGKYRFYNGLFGAAVTLGIKAPTGQTDERDSAGNRFEPEEQPGTGSTDFFFGMAINKNLGRFTIDGSILYQLTGSGAQEYEFGDVLNVGIQGTYKVKEYGRYPGLDILAGVVSEFADKDDQFRKRISDSGGTTVFFAPGLSSQLTNNLSSSFSVQFPILQNLGRDHQEVDLKVLFGIGYSF